MLAQVCRQSWFLTRSSLKARYRSTTAGMLWVLIAPILIYSAQAFAFHAILRIQVQNYPLFLLSSLLPWIFISSTLDMSVGTFVNQGRFIKSFRVHPIALVQAQVLDNFVNYSLSFFLLLIPVTYYSGVPAQRLLLLLAPLVLLILFVSGLSVLFATVHVFFRDTRFILTFLIQISYFLTPIFYPMELIPPELRWVNTINPITTILSPFQAFALSDLRAQYPSLLLKAALLSIVTLGAALFFWRKKRNAVYFQV